MKEREILTNIILNVVHKKLTQKEKADKPRLLLLCNGKQFYYQAMSVQRIFFVLATVCTIEIWS